MKSYIYLSIIFSILIIVLYALNIKKEPLSYIKEEKIEAIDIASHLPHKSLYKIKLISKKNGSNINNVYGKMFFEWKKSCNGWITSHKFNVTYDYIEEPSMNIISDFSTFESFNGKNFEFSSSVKKDNIIINDVSGSATKNNKNSNLAIFTRPKGLELDIGNDFFFPMEHTLMLLEKARKGKKFFNAKIFDGSDERGTFLINSFIGEQINAIAEISSTPDIDIHLINNKAWKIRMAFFTGENYDTSIPDYEMDVILHENGVISNVLIDYNEFVIEQNLIALDRIDKKKCDN